MANDKTESYGQRVRRVREEQDFGLREFAKLVGVSATYLSQVERGELPPPAEERVIKTAELLGLDRDELLALAGRVPSDLEDIILERPKETADLLRRVRDMTSEQVADLMKTLPKGRTKS